MCIDLSAVVNSTKIVKQGQGKKAISLEVYRHETKDFYRNRIAKSIEHYKALMENKGIILRDYQVEIRDEGVMIIEEYGLLYLTMEVRTGKTLTALSIAEEIRCKRVLFATKLKAIPSIDADYKAFSPSFEIVIINHESLHKVEGKFDMIIIDEAHRLGSIPKPSLVAKRIKELVVKNNPMVMLLSGTPTPESYSQMYHQVYSVSTNPFKKYVNFYKFAKDYVNVTSRMISGMTINDYSDGKYTIIEAMAPYTISYSQKEAGFEVVTKEHFLEVKMADITHTLAKTLKKELVIEGKEEVVLADTPVKLMMKLHQIYSGTVKFESGKSMITDLSKALFIKDMFKGQKIGIFYVFVEELNALKQVFGDDLCNDLSTFEGTDKSIALQIVSGREGISLKQASALVYYNISFSATSYWQSRDRMTTKDRLKNDVYWVFSDGGIERDIYKAVSKKKSYTLKHFERL